VAAAAAGDGPSESSSSLTSQLRSLRKRSAASSDDPTSTPEKKSAGPAATAVTHSRTNSTVKQSSDDLSTSTSRHTSPEKRPPVKLTVKFKDVNSSRSVKSCQVRVVNNTSVPAQEGSSKGHQLSSSSSTSSRDNGGIKTEAAEDDDDQEIDTKKSVVKSAHSSINHNSKATATNGDSKTKMTEPVDISDEDSDDVKVMFDCMGNDIKKEEVSDPELNSLTPEACLRPQLPSSQLLTVIDRLGFNEGDISTSLLSHDSEELRTRSIDPPKIPQVVLTRDELSPPTPCVFVKTAAEAFSPQLFELCLQRPIVVIRNLAPVCGIDMSLYGTKTLVESHPNHPIEIRSQVEQSADENWDPSFDKQVWYCTSSRTHTTINKYAEYQAAGLEEAYNEALAEAGGRHEEVDFGKMVNPPEFNYNSPDLASEDKVRKMLKFGTNCDLSDPNKWRPQLDELDKLPAWVRVISAGNMLSHLGHQILGMNTVQLYMKVPRARTPGHQENNNFCAVNLNVGPGDSEWFGVPNDYWGGLQAICKKNKVDFLHGSWWPKVSELHEAGIPVYRFMQKPGDLVWVNTGCVHWVQAAGWCNNIAWNVGPLTAHQFKVAIERYEWNKTQKYQSIVAMEFLSWNLARNICLSDANLFWQIKRSLMHSIRRIVQSLNFVKSRGVPVRFHGHRSHESAHYCGVCDEEVFNVLLIKDSEKRHVVHCMRCARAPNAGGKDLKGIIALVEYPLKDLLEIYDNFTLNKPPPAAAARRSLTTSTSSSPPLSSNNSSLKSLNSSADMSPPLNKTSVTVGLA